MTYKTHQAARDRRYDGPPPQDAAAWLDSETSWQFQIHTRRQQAWQTVRQAAQTVIAAKQDFRRAPSVETYRLWRLRRRALDYSLTGWAAFRDLERNGQNPDEIPDTISGAHNARSRSFP
jgi:hypothetical protein